MNSNRLTIIDGFRCIAALMVVFYHFLYRFSPPISDINYYPYEFGSSFLRFGFFGVQLFFVISGFVIYMTLQTTVGFSEFLLKRFVRLWPTLLLCCVITFAAVELFDPTTDLPMLHNKSLLDFLPSLTFTQPSFWSAVLGIPGIKYIDGVYWSLYIEVVFYIFAGAIYFFNPKLFFTRWLWMVSLLVVLRIATSPKLWPLYGENIGTLAEILYNAFFALGINHFIYFTIGILFFRLYSHKGARIVEIVVVTALTLLEFYFLKDPVLMGLLAGIIILFTVFVYRSQWLSFLNHNFFVCIGLSSYPLYLLHEEIGILLINKLTYISDDILDNKLLPFMVTFMLVIISYVIYLFFEKPAARYFRRWIKANN